MSFVIYVINCDVFILLIIFDIISMRLISCESHKKRWEFVYLGSYDFELLVKIGSLSHAKHEHTLDKIE